jgi:hypothetical protein
MPHYNAKTSIVGWNTRTTSRQVPVAIKGLEGKSLIGDPFWEGPVGSGQCPQDIPDHQGNSDLVFGVSFSARFRIGSQDILDLKQTFVQLHGLAGARRRRSGKLILQSTD